MTTTWHTIITAWRAPRLVAEQSEAKRRELHAWTDCIVRVTKEAESLATGVDGNRRVLNLGLYACALDRMLSALLAARAQITTPEAMQVAESAIRELERIRGERE